MEAFFQRMKSAAFMAFFVSWPRPGAWPMAGHFYHGKKSETKEEA